MSVENKNDYKYIKIAALAIGFVSIGGGLAPFLLDYFSAQSPTTTQIVKEEALPTPPETVSRALPTLTTSNSTTQSANTKMATLNDPVEPINLPSLHESDPFVLQKIAVSTEPALFVREDVINNMVVFIDNFSRGELVSNFSPLIKPIETFTVSKQGELLTIDDESYQRYDAYAQAVSKIDVQTFIDFYTQLMPLIDEAYQGIGYPENTFNQTFEKAIDHLLQAPIIRYKLQVEAPSAVYKYHDKNLESLPDTQKLLLRMGPDNLQIVQEKLLEIKNELPRL